MLPCLKEVVVLDAREGAVVRAQALVGDRDVALDHLRVAGDGEHLVAGLEAGRRLAGREHLGLGGRLGGLLALARLGRLGLDRDRLRLDRRELQDDGVVLEGRDGLVGPGDDLLGSRVEEIVGRRCALLPGLDEAEQIEQARVGDGVLGAVDRRAEERGVRSKSSSWAVWPMIAAACAGSCTSGSSITIWFEPCLVIVGSETPSWSTRLRMIEIASSMSVGVTTWPFFGSAWRTTSRPPLRSRPSISFRCAGEPGTPSSATPASAARTMKTSVRCERREAKLRTG